MRNKRGFTLGFTLIEILTVCAILIILAAILIPHFLYAKYQAMESVCEENERGLASALAIYSSDNSYNYPGTSPGLNALTPVYANGIPSCPSQSGAIYAYTATQDFQVYTIECTGNHTQVLGANSAYCGAGCGHVPEYSPGAGIILK